MKIAVDGYELGSEAKGVGRTSRNLLIPLFDLFPQDEFLICTKERIGMSVPPQVNELVLPWRGGYLRWQNRPLRRALDKAKPDIFIALNYLLPLIHRWKSVLFEHDISVISHPEWYPRRYALTRKILVRASLRKAAQIVVPSEFTKKEILAFYDVAPEIIRVIGHGVEESFRRASEERVLRWKERKGLEGKKVVGYLGSIFPRRHVPELIRAVDRLRREFPPAALYLVGEDFGVMGSSGIASLRDREWIRWEPALPEEELPLFYSALDAFAWLSEYEGFGFPPLEALACGTLPVLLNRASLREVFSGLAVMVENPEEMEVAAALRAALTDDTLRTKHLGEFERARSRFSWKTAAGEVAAVVRNLE
jgi:glycosyltransferase involved in cell wall biosynthesis